VLIGYGQVNHRDEIDPRTGSVEPVDLMAAAARQAADSRVLEAVDSIRVVNILSARYRDPGLLLGERIGAADFTTLYSPVGGNVPQSLVNQACLDIRRGRAGVVLLAGAETWRTRRGLKAKGGRLEWTVQGDSVPMAEVAGDDVPMDGDAETRIGLDRPAYVYPLFEQALRIANDESIEDHRRRVGELWARFNAVAVGNPHAWIRKPATAEEITRPGPQNRMISWPYTKLMNSNNMVDQGAALILTSVEQAQRLQIPAERWVYPQAGTDAHDTPAIADRDELHRSTAIRIAGARVLELADLRLDDVDYVDLYSCFPSAVQVAAAELGLAVDDPARPLTVTGGLTFAGGPWSNRHASGPDRMTDFIPPDPVTLIAWRQRLESWQEQYREGVAALDRLAGGDFAVAGHKEQDKILASATAGTFLSLLFEHTIEGMYANPEYGGNRGLAGWKDIRYPGDIQPRGYTSEEVERSDGRDPVDNTGIVADVLKFLGAV